MVKRSNNLKIGGRGCFLITITRVFATLKDNFKKLHHFHFTPAFTLAEVLITLGIIGIVAAMTIPNLINKYQEKVFTNRLIQSYAQLNQAFNLMIEENGTFDSYPNADERIKAFKNLFPNYLKISYHCNSKENNKQCMPSFYKNRFAETQVNVRPNQVMLPNGVAFDYVFGGYCFQNKNFTKKGIPGTTSATIVYGTYAGPCGYIKIDLNGRNLPNVPDKDMFQFAIMVDGIVPIGSKKERITSQTLDGGCLKSGGEGYCAAWVLENKNMDYFRCPDELSWTGNRSCPKK